MEGTAKRKACRVAYTINNTQPVISTIIGDQPLFYMDYDYSYEDEEDLRFDAAEMKILDSEIDSLRREIETIDKLSQSFALDSTEKVADFHANAHDMFAPLEVKEDADIEALLATLRESRLATAYLAHADKFGIKIQHSSQVQTASYDRNAGLISINPNIDQAEQQLLAIQELRRHWQHRQGALINPLLFHPDNAVLINRAQVADLAVSMIRVAWELQLAGDKAAWERIENSTLADLGRAFAREAYLDFRTINNGQASAAVFEAWFLTERCRAQDKILINQMLADHKGYVFDLGESEQNITPTLIAALGEMPFGKNYLAEHALTIMDDAIFTDVRDRSNANFLWFIKFERSFRETEQELQTHVDPSAGDIQSFAHNQKSGDLQNGEMGKQHGERSSAQIVQLFEETQIAEESSAQHQSGDNSGKKQKRLAPKSRIKRRNEKGGNSNVVYLRRQPQSAGE